MYLDLEHALYRAFNVSEQFYQRNQLADLYRTPDWETGPVMENRLTRLERIHQDASIYRVINTELPADCFHLLRIVYCRSLDIEDWRYSLDQLKPMLSVRIGRIRFNPMVYEYTCIKQLTGNKLKKLYIKNESARRNNKKICHALSDMTELAHQKAERVLANREMLTQCR